MTRPSAPALRTRALRATALALLLGGCADASTAPRSVDRPADRPSASIGPAVTVTNANDGGPGSLRQALVDVDEGGTITFDPALAGGVIDVSSGGSLGVEKSLTIDGPAGRVTIYGGGVTRPLVIGVGHQVTIKDLNLEGGRAGTGGGLLIAGSATATLERVRLSGNTAIVSGGGIASFGTLHAVDVSVERNTAASDQGGGIYNASTGTATLTSTTVRGNEDLNDHGGGIANLGSMQLLRSTVAENRTTESGGGIYNAGSLVVVNSTISGNTAAVYGGGIYSVAGGTLVLTSSTVAANTLPFGRGAGITVQGPTTLRNTIVAANDGVPPWRNCDLNAPIGSIVRLGTNLSDDTDCGDAGPALLVVGDAKLGALASNGGPTQTHALLLGSPAIDAATDCTVTVDQRAVARPQGAACDIGAHEFDAFTKVTLGITPSGTVNSQSGVAVVSGTVACSAAQPLTLRVTVRQSQKAGKVNTTVEATGTLSVECGASQAWAIAVTPPTGAFSISAAAVTVETVGTQPGVTPATKQATVKMAWTRR